MIVSINKDEFIVLESRHAIQRALNIVYGCLLFTWCMLTLVRNFSIDLFHVSFFLGYDIVYVVICANSIGWDLRVSKQGIIISSSRAISMMNLCVFLGVLALSNNITHLVFTAVELYNNNSELVIVSYWFVFVFALGLGMLIALDVVQIYYFFRYRVDIAQMRDKKKTN